ncbi:MAG: 30S ribosomal protein S12 methylthiotransferase RimO [Planctomycetota bacterium]
MTPPAPLTPEAPSPAQSAADTAVSDVATVAMISLGCPKNLVDSEKMLGLLAESGVAPVPPDELDTAGADAVVINTCGFLEASKEESLGEIKRSLDLKKQGKVGRVVVAGCLVQRQRAKLLEWAPGIDALIGVYDRERVIDAVTPKAEPVERDQRGDPVALPVYSSLSRSPADALRKSGVDGPAPPGYFESDAARLRLTPRHYAYLRLGEGCNQACAFCTIPSIRGRLRSKPIDQLEAEARELMTDGAAELLIIGQDTTSYGSDLPGAPYDLTHAIERLDAVAAEFGGAWLRLMYAYPSCFEDRMIDALAGARNVTPYLDMPLQHIDDTVLDRMRRKTARSLIETLLDKLHTRIPNLAMRTTFISGFPGETEAQHQSLVQFIRDQRFENVGVFPYSPEPGTPAAKMHKQDAIPDDVIQRRIGELMTAQQEVVFARNRQRAEESETIAVVIDSVAESQGQAAADVKLGLTPGAKHAYLGRSYRQAPEIDGVTRVLSRNPLSPGERVRCQTVAFDGYDLIARPADDAQRRLSLPLA